MVDDTASRLADEVSVMRSASDDLYSRASTVSEATVAVAEAAGSDAE